MSPAAIHAATSKPAVWTDCRLCACRLIYNRRVGNHVDDLLKTGLCAECQTRPEARRFGVVVQPGAGYQPTPASGPPQPPQGWTGAVLPRSAPTPPAGPRAFNGAEKALIKACIKNYMPAAQLLDVLNTRLVADIGEKAVLFTMEALWEEAKGAIDPSEGRDWAGLRKVIAQARRSGLLATITTQIVDDVSTVFQLSAAQRTHLRDVIRGAQEER